MLDTIRSASFQASGPVSVTTASSGRPWRNSSAMNGVFVFSSWPTS
jgi:hypothetical protein